jgi:hypothetical protein
VAAHPAGNMSKDDVPVIKFDGKRRTWKDLFDAADHLDWALFDVLSGVGFGLAWSPFLNSATDSYRKYSLLKAEKCITSVDFLTEGPMVATFSCFWPLKGCCGRCFLARFRPRH